MDDLVSNAQSAFIKKRSIHDNFLYVKNLAMRFHKNKTPTLLFKLDIRKAFDSTRWDTLLIFLRGGVSQPVSGIGLWRFSTPPLLGCFSTRWPAVPIALAEGFGKETPSHRFSLSLPLTL
jgi:hypothetical protein